MSVLIIFIKLIAVFDLLVIAVYFGGDILSTMLNKLRRKPKQDDPFDFSLDTVTVSLSIDSIRQLCSDDAADFVEEKILPNAEKTMAVLTEQEQTAAHLLLSALIGFLAVEAPMDEQSFPLMMELLNCMEGEKEDGCDDPFDFSLDTMTVSLSIDSIRQLYSGDAADFVEEKILPNAEKTMAVLTEQERTAARLLLSALIGFLAAEAPMDEQSFPLMMELLNCMEGEKEDGCQDAVDSLLEDAACNTRRHEEYYSNYQRYQLMQVDKTRVILACRIIINDLLGKLYRYDYRFGYNLLLDEENSIEKKLHTPVREEWEAEDDEI